MAIEVGRARAPGRKRALALAAGSAMALGASATVRAGTTWTVDSCADTNSGDSTAHTGTLRYAATHAASGDTVALTTLCSTISLTTGRMAMRVDDLTISGPAERVTIDASQNGTGGTLYHGGYGTLTLQNLRIVDGQRVRAGYSLGGCVESYGNVVLDHVEVSGCLTEAGNGPADGGAVSAWGNVTLHSSSITQSTVRGSSSARGGGISARGNVHAEYSTIDGNSAILDPPSTFGGEGGAVFAPGVFLRHSTVANNYASGGGGGVVALKPGQPGNYLRLESATVSGNRAGLKGGGIYASVPEVTVHNSTVAGNVSKFGLHSAATGLALVAYNSPMTVKIVSTLVSDNILTDPNPNGDGSTEYDFSVVSAGSAFTIDAASANNFVRRPGDGALPLDTIVGACPLLGRLRDNGGPTQTMALLSGSPALDVGSNPLAETQDQRGAPGDPGPPYAFARESNGLADIGAYELQQGDGVFSTGFETCTALPP